MKKLFKLLLSAIISCNAYDALQAQCDCDPVRDSLALMDLRNNTNISFWDTEKPIATWAGIRLNSSGCVERLVLNNKGILGTVPASIFENLWCLKILNLSADVDAANAYRCYVSNNVQREGNMLGGTIPEGISNLTQLEVLDLSQSRFTGFIPESIGRLSKLKALYLSKTKSTSADYSFNPHVPATIGNLTNLEVLDLSNNKIPEVPNEIEKLTNLKILRFGCNSLSQFPDGFSNLRNLEELYIASNQLMDSIPGSVNNLSKLRLLDVSYNDLYKLPTILIDSLERIYLNFNKLTFDDMLPNIQHLGSESFANYQTPFFPDTTFLFTPCEPPIIDLGIDQDITDNYYAWFKDDSLIATSRIERLDLAEIFQDYTDYAGTYTCRVTNNLLSDVTLLTGVITIKLSSTCLTATKVKKDTLCYHDEVIVNGTVYNQMNPKGCKVLKGTPNACDTMLILDLHFRDTFDIVDTTLDWGERILVNNTWYDCANTSDRQQFISPFTGCDSTVYIYINCNIRIDDINNLKVDAFTPNGDYINETFIIPIIGLESGEYKQNELLVFDRWKKLVYSRKNYTNDWNGTDLNGNPLPAGTYYYIFHYGASLPLNRIVTIIR